MKPDSEQDPPQPPPDKPETPATETGVEPGAPAPAAIPTGLEEDDGVVIEFLTDTAADANEPAVEVEPPAAAEPEADGEDQAGADKQRIASLTRLVARSRFEMDHFQEEIESLKRERDKLQREAKELGALLEKRQAEAAATRAQVEKKLEDQLRDGAVPLLKELMTVVDHLDLALRTSSKEDPLYQGIEMTRSEMLGILKRNGAEPIEAMGTPFNPRFHEATAAEYRDGLTVDTIIDELRRGWQRGGKVLRPTLARVGKPAEKQPE